MAQTTPIIIFHHGLFVLGEPPEILPAAIDIAFEQMAALKSSGLQDAASEINLGINGTPDDSGVFVTSLFPEKARVVYHGRQCRNECRSIVMIEQWLSEHSEDAYILYEHQKGSTHIDGSDYSKFAARWRRCMTDTCVHRWRECVAALDAGFEAVGSHWLTGMCDGTQHYFAGTFFWATSKYLRTLPSIYKRERIKVSGIDSIESRYEAEVWLGNGPRLPKIKEMTTHGLGGCP